jgi:hypothetical protein
MENVNYIISDEAPNEGDYGITPFAPDRKPRLVVKNNSGILGMELSKRSWFSWMPLEKHHRKVIFKSQKK